MAFNYNLLLVYLCIFLAGFIVLNIMTNGFILQWWRVRKSRGKLVLIKIHHAVSNYWRAGSIEKGFIQFTARKRRDNPDPKRMISVSDDVLKKAVHHDWNVNWIEVDDEKECVFYFDEGSYKSVSGANTEKTDALLQTALNKPSKYDGLLDPRTFQIIVLLGLVLLIIGIIVLYQQFGTMEAHLKLIYDQTTPLYNHLMNTTGGVPT